MQPIRTKIRREMEKARWVVRVWTPMGTVIDLRVYDDDHVVAVVIREGDKMPR